MFSAFAFLFLFNHSLCTAAIHPTNALVLCKNQKIVRTIRVEVKDDKSCETKYTKAGVDRTIGTGNYETSCDRFLNNVKGNLQTAGWKCKDVSSAKIVSE